MNIHEETLKIARNLIEKDPSLTEWVISKFPELKESEDEIIRKKLITFFQRFPYTNLYDANLNVKDVLAWLEKQGEQKHANKIEPKFHEGDWVMLDRPVLITKVEDMPYNTHQYWTSDGTWFGDATKAKSWTIQDAKDGDVLCCESGWTCIFKALNSDISFSSYCFMDDTGWFCETGSESHTLNKVFMKAYNGNIYPATKEQRDTLMKAMADAGYTFDFEKKELKKL